MLMHVYLILYGLRVNTLVGYIKPKIQLFRGTFGFMYVLSVHSL